MKDFLLETADTTTVEKQIEESVKMVCGWLNITTLSSASSNPQFKKLLYSMLEKYTQTPTEIADLMTAKTGQIENVVNCIMSLKFTEYTMEEDIISVLFSFIGTEGTAE